MMKKFTLYVALMTLLIPFGLKAESLTVCDGTNTNNYLPMYAYYMDRAQQYQMIYPAELLSELEGSTLTGMTFYIPQPANTRTQTWENTSIVVSLAEVEQTEFNSQEFLTASLKEVATCSAKIDPETTEWAITFTVPYEYKGGNLLVNMACTQKNVTTTQIYWAGQNQTYISGVIQAGTSLRNAQFLPKMTVDYSSEELGPMATISTTILDFPLTFVGETSELTLIVNNVGSTTLSGSVMIIAEEEGVSPFTVTPSEITNLEAGESVDLVVTYSPAETSSEDVARMMVNLGDAGKHFINLAGTALEIPSGYRELFNADNYSTTMPDGWTAYCEEYSYNSTTEVVGGLIDWTSDYSADDPFSSSRRFSSYTFNGANGIAWEHVNWSPNSDVYVRYFYLISPAISGEVMLRAKMTDLPAAGCFVQAYPVKSYDEAEDMYYFSNNEIEIDWQTELSNTAWSVGTFEVNAPTQIAFFLKFAVLDFVASTEKTSSIECIKPVVSSETTYVFDIAGRQVSTEKFTNGQVPAGIYIIRRGADVKKVIR